MTADTTNLEALFDEASRLCVHEREDYVRGLYAHAPEMAQRLQRLLHALDNSDAVFARDPASLASSGDFSLENLSKPPEQIGRYKVLHKLGEGGCGLVYLAEQEEPIRRRVALKIIKAGMDTGAVIARFEAERQAVALMDHPNIAKVLDAGSTDSGRPYFVMELVEGRKITDYCAKLELSIDDRLHLFLQVCDGVQHAHQKGIIHRDLKPSNILVSIPDPDLSTSPPVSRTEPSHASSADLSLKNGIGAPKIIDFGIAKSLSVPLTDATIHTGLHQFIGTPAYMSPEQADLNPDIDTRTDIYSLGVLLYELLTGKPPFDNHELLTAGVDGMRRVIREVLPKRPSRLSEPRMANPLTKVGADLDWIVMKCLEKDRTRRYDAVTALAADVQRYLSTEPILARPPTASYRVQKLLARHRTAALAIGLVILAVLGAAGVSSWALLQERTARRRADHRLNSALNFVDELFTEIAPAIGNVPGAASVNEKLAQSGLKFIQNLSEGFTPDPALRLAIARLLLKVSQQQNPGNANTVGEYETGLKRAREALAVIGDRSLELQNPERLKLMYETHFAAAQCLAGLSRFDEAVGEWKTSLLLLDDLAKFPGLTRYVARERACVAGNAGYSLTLVGRGQSGIEDYLLPALNGDWTRQITNNVTLAWPNELEAAANLYDNLAAAHLFLGRFDEMLPFGPPALAIWDYLVAKYPQNGVYLALRAESMAHHALASLVSGSTDEGFAVLAKARSMADKLAEADKANDRFVYTRALVTAIQALACAHECDRANLSERPGHLEKARSLLREAGSFAAAGKTGIPAPYIELARQKISQVASTAP